MSRMQLSIIAQFQDRASRGMRTLLRLQQQHERMQKAYGRSTQEAARAQQRLATASRTASGAMQREATASQRLRTALARVNAMIAKQVSLRERLRRAGSLAREGAGRIGRAGAMAAGIYGSVQATAASAASLVVGPAAQVEGYMVQLEALEGSTAKAKAAMSWIMQFARKTPLQLDQVIEAYAQLRNFGLNPTNGTLQALVDTMAMSGKGADHLQGIILALGQAWVKGKLQGEEIMQLTEKSVPVWDLLAKATGKSVPVLQKLSSQGKLGRNVIAKLIQLMGERAAGASEKFARTWNGMVTNMADMWFKFRLMVAHSGVFDFLKEKLRYVLDIFNRLEASGKLQQVAQQIGTSIISGLKAVWQFGLGVWAVLQKVGAALSWAAEKLGGWNNLAMVLMALPIINVLASFVSGVMLLGQAFMMLIPAVSTLAPLFAALATPIGLAVAGIAAVGAAIAGVIWYFDLWPSITAAVSAAWSGLLQAGRALISFFAGLPARIAAAWQAFRQWLAQPFDPFPNLRQRVQGILAMLAALPQQAMQAISRITAAIRALDIGALINPVNWPGLLMQGLQGALAGVRRLVSVLGLGNLVGGIDWNAILPAGLQGAISRITAAIRALDISALISPANWPGLLQRGLLAALQMVRSAFAGLDLTDAGARIMRSLWEGMKRVAASLLDWARGLASRIGQAFMSAISWTKNLAAKAGNAVSSMFGGSRQSAAQLQARASGGAFGRGPLLVGEQGPELIYASRAGWVAHNDNLQRIQVLAQRAAAALAGMGLAGHLMMGSALPALAAAQPEPVSPSPQALAASASRAGASAGGSGQQTVQVHYAPQITVHGNADPAQIRQALDAHLDDLLDRLQRRQQEQERLEF